MGYFDKADAETLAEVISKMTYAELKSVGGALLGNAIDPLQTANDWADLLSNWSTSVLDEIRAETRRREAENRAMKAAEADAKASVAAAKVKS